MNCFISCCWPNRCFPGGRARWQVFVGRFSAVRGREFGSSCHFMLISCQEMLNGTLHFLSVMRCFAFYGRFSLSQRGKVVPGSAIAKCIAKPAPLSCGLRRSGLLVPSCSRFAASSRRALMTSFRSGALAKTQQANRFPDGAPQTLQPRCLLLRSCRLFRKQDGWRQQIYSRSGDIATGYR